jgi:hypothetical protein
MTLYELSTQYRALEEALGSMDDAEQVQSALAELNDLGDSIQDKALGIARVLKNLGAEVDAIKAEEQRLATRRKTVENNITRLKTYAVEMLDAAGIDSAKDDLFSVRVQDSPPSVDVHDPDLVPETYYVSVDPRLDKRSLLDDLKAGKDVPGAALMRSRSLRVR